LTVNISWVDMPEGETVTTKNEGMIKPRTVGADPVPASTVTGTASHG
jgi:hypothetical protein